METPIYADRDKCRQMVEDMWRAFLRFTSEGNAEAGKMCILQFDEKIQRMASDMPGNFGKQFLILIDGEREELFNEYTENPDGLKRRLGLVPRTQSASYSRQSLGEVAVKAAVRATVWESIIGLFRLFR